jgi:hypothetical protein
MKTIEKLFLISFSVALLFTSCNKNEFSNISDVKLKVTFDGSKSLLNDKIDMTVQTPDNYLVALKSVTIVGDNGTPDFEIFSKENLASSLVFDYTDTETVHSLMQGTTVPDGTYSSVRIEIFYLQMKLNIASSTAIEKRNIRIYLSDDAENEGGLHQPGDLTQITEEGVEQGWLLGEGQIPDMSPVSPRVSAYTHNSDGINWYDFAGKPGNNYGPFGDTEFMTAPHPIYYTTIEFSLIDNGGTNIVLDFNVNGCWQFEDKSGDGAFGAADLDSEIPTRWSMLMPEMTVTLEQ